MIDHAGSTVGGTELFRSRADTKGRFEICAGRRQMIANLWLHPGQIGPGERRVGGRIGLEVAAGRARDHEEEERQPRAPDRPVHDPHHSFFSEGVPVPMMRVWYRPTRSSLKLSTTPPGTRISMSAGGSDPSPSPKMTRGSWAHR